MVKIFLRLSSFCMTCHPRLMIMMKACILLIYIFIFTDLWTMPIVYKSAGPTPNDICRIKYQIGNEFYLMTGTLMGDYILTSKHGGINARVFSITCSPNIAIDITNIIRTAHPNQDLELIQLNKKYSTNLLLPNLKAMNFYWKNYNNKIILPLDSWGYGDHKTAKGITLWQNQSMITNYTDHHEIILPSNSNGRAIPGDSGGPLLFSYKKKQYVFGILIATVKGNNILTVNRKNDIIAEIIGQQETIDWIQSSHKIAKYALHHQIAFTTRDRVKIQSLLKKNKRPY